jgi:hypothetical protein
MCQRRSPVLPIFVQFSSEIVPGNDGRARWSVGLRYNRRCYPAFSDSVGKDGVSQLQASLRTGSHQLRDHLVAIGYENCLTTRSQTNILTQLILENFDTHSVHVKQRSFRKLLFQGAQDREKGIGRSLAFLRVLESVPEDEGGKVLPVYCW